MDWSHALGNSRPFGPGGEQIPPPDDKTRLQKVKDEVRAIFRREAQVLDDGARVGGDVAEREFLYPANCGWLGCCDGGCHVITGRRTQCARIEPLVCLDGFHNLFGGI